MRIVLVGLVSLAATTLCFGQGQVLFSTFPGDLSSPPDRLVRYTNGLINTAYNPYGTNNAGAVNVGTISLRAQLYYGSSVATEGSLIAVTNNPALFRASTTTIPGTFQAAPTKAVTVIGFTNSNDIKLQVKVWDSQYAPTYDAAAALGPAYPGLLGKSSVFGHHINDSPNPAPSSLIMTGLQSFAINVPSQVGPALVATNPSPLVKIVGETATFVGAGAGEPTLGYQWFKSPATPVGINSSTLTLNNVQLSSQGLYYFVVTNSSGSSTSSTASLTVTCPTITVSSSTLSNSPTGVPYNATFGAAGGTGPYTFAASGSLPTGLSLSTAGVLSGIPTQTGPFNFTVTATDNTPSACQGSTNVSITIDCPVITLSPSTLTTPVVLEAYSETVSGVGGVAPYTFALNTNSPYGPLPTGLSLTESNGLISGVPSGPGTFISQIIATDANGCTGTRDYTNTAGSGGLASPITLDIPKTKTDWLTSAILMAGKVTADPNGFSSIDVNVNGAFQSGATIHTNGTKITWTNSGVVLATGTNTVYARLVNGQGGKSYSKTNLVFLKVPQALTLTVNGTGTVTGKPLNVPTPGLVPSPAVVATPGVSPTLDIGRNYTLIVDPTLPAGKGENLLSNIVVTTTTSTNIYYAPPGKEAQKGNKKFIFTMGTNTTVTVNFVTNRFKVAAGFYYGLYSEAGTAHESSGWFQIKTDSKLKFSGKFLQEGEPASFSGTFNLEGVGTPKTNKNIARKTFPNDILTVGIQLDLTSTSNTVTGTVSSTNWGSAADMLSYKLIPLAISNTALPGFAMVMVGNTNAATYPAGDGYLLAKDPIDALVDGKLKKAKKGYTGEGKGTQNKIKATTTGVSTDGGVPFYAALYKDPVNTKNHHGSMIGWLNLSNGIVTGDVIWTKRSTAAASDPTLPYSGGFTTMFSSADNTLLSSPVSVPSGPPVAGVPLAGNITVQDGGYFLGSPYSTTYTYGTPTPSKFVAAGKTTNGITASFSAGTTEAKGNIDLVPHKWVGVVLQNANTVYGSFNTGGSTSGSVRLTP